LILHQANQRIIEAVAEQLQIDKSKVVMTVQRHADTLAASIPLALDSLHSTGQLQRGDKILFAGIGAGMVINGMLLNW